MAGAQTSSEHKVASRMADRKKHDREHFGVYEDTGRVRMPIHL